MNITKKKLNLIAAGLFALNLLNISSFNFYTILAFAGLAALVAAMLTEKYMLVIVGAALRGVPMLLSNLFNMRHLFRWIENDMGWIAISVLSNILFAVAYGLLAYAAYKRENTKQLGMIAAGIVVASYLFCVITNVYGFSFGGLLTRVMTAAPMMLTGMILEGAEAEAFAMPAFAGKAVAAAAAPAAPEAPAVADARPKGVTDRFEQLTRLKALVDSGILTQEEFDGKKKQLLDL